MSKSIRSRQFMFEQQINHLNYPISDLKNYFEKSGAIKWAYIIHDQDVRSDNSEKLVNPHIHGVLQYKNARDISSIAKMFLVEPQYIEKWTGRINNAWSYLIHKTKDASSKFQYSPDNVIASFDFKTEINKISTFTNDINDILDQYASDSITLEQLRQKMSVRTFAKNRREIDDISHTLAEFKHDQWLYNRNPDIPMELIWIWGFAGTGKSRLADTLTIGQNVAKGGASNDYFQNYHGETIIILDDLRPNEFKWSDFLTLTDPHQFNKEAPRRYHNVPLNLEQLIITTPFSPKQFYNYSKISNRQIDTVEQLLRRINQEIHLTPQSPFIPNKNDNSLTLPNDSELPF